MLNKLPHEEDISHKTVTHSLHLYNPLRQIHGLLDSLLFNGYHTTNLAHCQWKELPILHVGNYVFRAVCKEIH